MKNTDLNIDFNTTDIWEMLYNIIGVTYSQDVALTALSDQDFIAHFQPCLDAESWEEFEDICITLLDALGLDNMKKTYILNIGFNTSLNFHNEVMQIDLEGIKNAISEAGLVIEGDIKILQSNTEQTAVLSVSSMVELDGASVYPEIYTLSVLLMQDCIACYDVDLQEGQLIGRHANEWGTFDSKFFLMG